MVDAAVSLCNVAASDIIVRNVTSLQQCHHEVATVVAGNVTAQDVATVTVNGMECVTIFKPDSESDNHEMQSARMGRSQSDSHGSGDFTHTDGSATKHVCGILNAPLQSQKERRNDEGRSDAYPCSTVRAHAADMRVVGHDDSSNQGACNHRDCGEESQCEQNHCDVSERNDASRSQ